MKLTVVPIASLPVPGLPPSAVDSIGATDRPSRYEKPQGYTAIELAVDGDAGGPGSFAVYRFWYDTKTWRPEGPKGATPTGFQRLTPATAPGADAIPVRISVPNGPCDLCVVRTAGAAITTGGLEVCELLGQER